MTAAVGTNRILFADSQNAQFFYAYHFNAANGYVAVPDSFSLYTR